MTIVRYFVKMLAVVKPTREHSILGFFRMEIVKLIYKPSGGDGL